jgi:hypothetical protein
VIGVHPSPRQAIEPPLPLHVEVIAWFSPAIPPSTERTVIVRVAGQPGTWLAFHDREHGWLSATDGTQIDEPIEAWADRPTGEAPVQPQHGAASAAVVAKLAKSTLQGYGLRLTPTGQALPPGLYELQLVPTSTTRSPT